ncbi:MAG: hypothetical protein KDE45_24595, partial [Caldilineaceae bacterium]|nr:hypothetical protein [Caldilineaceae bacterium]
MLKRGARNPPDAAAVQTAAGGVSEQLVAAIQDCRIVHAVARDEVAARRPGDPWLAMRRRAEPRRLRAALDLAGKAAPA